MRVAVGIWECGLAMYVADAQSRSDLPELFSARRWAQIGKKLGLTERQLEVARLICCGRTNAEIARNLEISERTVRLHTDRLFKRLGVRSRVGVVVRLVLTDRRLR